MNKKQTKITLFSLSLSVLLGGFSGYVITKEEHHTQAAHTHAVYSEKDSLEEEVISPDLIVKGTIEERLDTFKQDAGVTTPYGPLEFDVTTFKVKVDKVLDGKIESDSLILYQHGSPDDYNYSKNHVKKGEKVYLLLSERPDGKGYWSYNFEDGIWKVKKGANGELVNSNTTSKNLKSINNKSINDFEKAIKEARKEAKN